jgi:hypothetical protein
MNREEIRRRNLALEQEQAQENEAAVAEAHRDDIVLNENLFTFNFRDLSKSTLFIHGDEALFDRWHEFSEEANIWFNAIYTRAVLNAPAVNQQGVLAPPNPVPQNYLNQLSDVEQLNYLHNVAKQLGMDKKTFMGKPFGVFVKLDQIVQLRNQVLTNHQFCLSALKKFFFKIRERGDACFKYLKQSIHEAIASGIFLRKYRRDRRSDEFEADEVSPGTIIDFRNAEQRMDYLNPDVSEFVEPQLELAERYFQRLVRENEERQQDLANQRLRDAMRPPAEQRQPGGNRLKSKKNNNVRKLSKRNN